MSFRIVFYWGAFLSIVILVIFFFRGSSLVTMSRSGETDWMMQAHKLGILMFNYSMDHDQKYPDGKSSTEIFQKLLDGGYTNDPTIFYTPLPGKIKPQAGQKLRPENVCWDVTVDVASNDSDALPLVYMTGYKINYIPDGAARPLMSPSPQFGIEIKSRSWIEWISRREEIVAGPQGIAVVYKSNGIKFLKPENLDGSIPDFIPANFDAHGKEYHQLTPEGMLP